MGPYGPVWALGPPLKVPRVLWGPIGPMGPHGPPWVPKGPQGIIGNGFKTHLTKHLFPMWFFEGGAEGEGDIFKSVLAAKKNT